MDFEWGDDEKKLRNSRPTAVSFHYDILEDQDVFFFLRGNDADPGDRGNLIFTIMEVPQNGYVVTDLALS